MAHPWDHPGDHDGESKEVFYLRHLVKASKGLGDLLVGIDINITSLMEGQEKIMASLDGLTAAVALLGTAVTDMQGRLAADEAAEQAAADALTAQIADLQAQVAALQADAVDQSALDALVATITAIAATVAGIAAPPVAPVP